MTDKNISPSRRNLLKGVAGASALPFVGAFMAMQAQQTQAANGSTALVDSPYGPIRAVKDMTTGLPLLQLLPGFTYKSFGWRVAGRAEAFCRVRRMPGQTFVTDR